jgi:hypothetical protein
MFAETFLKKIITPEYVKAVDANEPDFSPVNTPEKARKNLEQCEEEFRLLCADTVKQVGINLEGIYKTPEIPNESIEVLMSKPEQMDETHPENYVPTISAINSAESRRDIFKHFIYQFLAYKQYKQGPVDVNDGMFIKF